MRQRLSTRTEEAIETWQLVAEQIIREPVREAVREALADEGVTPRGSVTGRPTGDESADGGRSVLAPKLLVPLFGLVAAMLYARRRMSGPAREGAAPEAEERAATPAGRGAAGSERPPTGEESDAEREGDAEGSDEGAAARS